jgi:hypothetical protein
LYKEDGEVLEWYGIWFSRVYCYFIVYQLYFFFKVT